MLNAVTALVVANSQEQSLPTSQIIEIENTATNMSQFAVNETTTTVVRTGSQLQEQTYGNSLALSGGFYDIFTKGTTQKPYEEEDVTSLPEKLIVIVWGTFLGILNMLALFEGYLILKNRKST
jgi:hypothetical protein